jgi:hypothetical protein
MIEVLPHRTLQRHVKESNSLVITALCSLYALIANSNVNSTRQAVCTTIALLAVVALGPVAHQHSVGGDYGVRLRTEPRMAEKQSVEIAEVCSYGGRLGIGHFADAMCSSNAAMKLKTACPLPAAVAGLPTNSEYALLAVVTLSPVAHQHSLVA